MSATKDFERLRIGVVGAGHLGKIHCKLIRSVDDADLVAVCDPSPSAREFVEREFGVEPHEGLAAMLPRIDAAIVAAATPIHGDVVGRLLEAGKHVFCEKPLTHDAETSRRLAMTAATKRLTLQVGHVERFNPAFVEAGDHLVDAKYIEATRASSFPGRCLDVGVVMDLMIHDIDLVLSLASGGVTDIRATGLSVISEHEDVAEARLEFSCGLVANLQASRISPTACRTMRVLGPRGLVDLDFSGPTVSCLRPSPAVADRKFRLSEATENPMTFKETLFDEHLVADRWQPEPRNAILDEQHDFVLSIRSGSAPTVDGHAGALAVTVAERILEEIEAKDFYGNGHADQTGMHAEPRRRLDDSRRAA